MFLNAPENWCSALKSLLTLKKVILHFCMNFENSSYKARKPNYSEIWQEQILRSSSLLNENFAEYNSNSNFDELSGMEEKNTRHYFY